MANSKKLNVPEYLGNPKLPYSPYDWRSVVKDAYKLEHNVTTNKAIGELLGLTSGRISHYLAQPEKLRAETLLKILAPIKTHENRRRIIRVWNMTCFGFDIAERPSKDIVGSNPTETTVEIISRFIREGRLSTAATAAFNASEKTGARHLKAKLLDMAYYAHQRQDQPGRAMKIALELSNLARAEGNQLDLIKSHMTRVRILLGLPDISPAEVAPAFEAIDRLQLLLGSKVSRSLLEQIDELKIMATLRHMESRKEPVNEEWLETTRKSLVERLGKPQTFDRKFRIHMSAAKCSFLLGQFIEMQEHLSAASRSAKHTNYHASETARILEAKKRVQENPKQALGYLAKHIELCTKSGDLYHLNMTERAYCRAINSSFEE